MRERLFDPARTAAATRMKTLHDERLADKRFGNDESVDVEIVIVFRVGDSRLKRLADGAGNPLAGEFQIGERSRHLLAANERGNEVKLLRADADRAQNSTRLVVSKPARSFGLAHRYFLFAFLSAPWP